MQGAEGVKWELLIAYIFAWKIGFTRTGIDQQKNRKWERG